MDMHVAARLWRTRFRYHVAHPIQWPRSCDSQDNWLDRFSANAERIDTWLLLWLGEGGTIALPVSNVNSITLAAEPQTYRSPLTYRSPAERTDEVLDEEYFDDEDEDDEDEV